MSAPGVYPAYPARTRSRLATGYSEAFIVTDGESIDFSLMYPVYPVSGGERDSRTRPALASWGINAESDPDHESDRDPDHVHESLSSSEPGTPGTAGAHRRRTPYPAGSRVPGPSGTRAADPDWERAREKLRAAARTRRLDGPQRAAV